MNGDRCAWTGCRCREIELIYRGRPLCLRHWQRLCALTESGRWEEAMKPLGLRPPPGRA